MSDLRILGISGSLRADSHNSALLRAAAKFAPEGVSVELYQGLRDLPPYDQDFDTEHPPAAVAELRRQISEADGVLIATPEYNYGVPGALKNAIDWASRPAATSSLKGKPVAIMGAAPTNFGGVRAQLSLRQSFLWIDSLVVGKPEVIVFRSHERFDGEGNLVDEGTRELIVGLLDALVATILQSAPVPAAA
jgi:chromate reductase, NAD(P)H dehydrogenase (quinone)